MTILNEHPLRKVLTDEIHTRPYLNLRTPIRVSHIAAITGEGGAEEVIEHLSTLCRRNHVEPPAPKETHFITKIGELTIKWERHTEFSTFTFFLSGPFDEPFQKTAIEELPEEWLRALPGDIMVAVHVFFEEQREQDRDVESLAVLFNHNTVFGSRVFRNKARTWTDHRVHDDGFERVLICQDEDINQREAGRLIQRILEIKTYRMVALLGFPLAREALPRIAMAEKKLGYIVAQLSELGDDANERQLLKELSILAAEVETIVAKTAYRFSASRAYYNLVCQRVAELREERLPWMEPVGLFIERRLSPPMETCKAVTARQLTLSQRISRATGLLRTRIDVALEEQN
jgi:uncharacterized membrane-anchored protein